MKFRTILSGIVAMPLLTAGAGATERNAQPGIEVLPGITMPLPKGWLGGGNRRQEAERERLAQAGDPRVTALEEQIRQLSGTIEELNFQILQMQEQMRKMQEDNEFRFQELEGKRSEAGGKPKHSSASPPASKPATAATESGSADGQPMEQPAATGPLVEAPAASAEGNAPPPGVDPSLTPKQFGTITFDQNGNVTGGSVGDQAMVGGTAPLPDAAPADPAAQGADNTVVAALPSTNDPEELYRNSYQFILSGDYGTAEAGFRDHIARFPEDAKAPDAHFWLGEALLGQKKYRDAAEVFLAANKDYPKSKKAPEMLFKLGVSLAGLNQREVACATFSEVGKRYPQTSAALQERVKQEQSLAGC
ncbi:MAG: tol-pal system protein YbgF [Mesorhizobium sp.]